MPIRLNKANKILTSNSFIEASLNDIDTQKKFPFSYDRSSNKYSVVTKKFVESSENKISFDNDSDTMSVTAKKLIEDGKLERPFKAIIPEFEVIGNKFYIKQSTLDTYGMFGINKEDLIVGIQVKHATFSRGKYKKSTKKRKLLGKNKRGKTKWSTLRAETRSRPRSESDPEYVSPYKYGYNSKTGTWVTPGYQHSGSQFRKHFRAIKSREHYKLTTRPQRYFYGDSYFTYLYIASNREVVFLHNNVEKNAYVYFQSHQISKADYDNEDNTVSSTKWLKYNFILKTKATGTLQSSDFFKVYYNSSRNMTNIVI